MAICKHYGFPSLFITFTCNPTWPEITRYVKKKGLNANDRPDIISRIFKIKLDSLMFDLTEKQLLGKTIAAMYTVEFQKKGLPHAHILLFMDKKSKLPTSDEINNIICAEIPDKEDKPELYEIIKYSMIHGPCGAANKNSPCMVDGKCSKMYLKSHAELTRVGKDGYPIYRRRRTTRYIEKGGFNCDNRYVVPYNEKLCLQYKAHINVEWCNQTGSVKYLFKYINKGPDLVAVVVKPVDKSEANTTTNVCNSTQNQIKKNEIKYYFDCRYVSAAEAIWRIYKFPRQFRTTPVQKLSFHIEGKKPCYFKKDDDIEEVLEKSVNEDSQLTGWFYLNQVNPDANQYLYLEIPAHFTWQGKQKQWKERKRGFSLGRINYVPHCLEAKYFMRILLNIVRGPKSFEDIKTYRGVVYKTYKDACFARDSLSRPEHVWEKTWIHLSEDIETNKRNEYNNTDLNLSDADKRNYALIEIEKLML
ncbi:PREDICTED: uncharacterized protein LOC104704714 [Camelina sativa]|uniref:Uncharacterized protein LOC104704714 n=1 Tax=Camelina sativa TaxID=90675 RepID=A0ABM0T0R7_CAMSA|nr:PREDICTED: uncharacterized protein LOC104704714 [Camelina sativa]